MGKRCFPFMCCDVADTKFVAFFSGLLFFFFFFWSLAVVDQIFVRQGPNFGDAETKSRSDPFVGHGNQSRPTAKEQPHSETKSKKGKTTTIVSRAFTSVQFLDHIRRSAWIFSDRLLQSRPQKKKLFLSVPTLGK